jgi:hypothetical protein
MEAKTWSMYQVLVVIASLVKAASADMSEVIQHQRIRQDAFSALSAAHSAAQH